ncbi:MAG: S8 family peptidase [Candidatus Caldarchaeum sp.]
MITPLIVASLLLAAFSTTSEFGLGNELRGVIIYFAGKQNLVKSLVGEDSLDALVEDVATARLTSHQIQLVERAGAKVYRPRILKPLLDLSVLDIGVKALENLKGVNAEAVDGTGVLIALVDTGVDYTHPAFRSKDGRNRILYIWDQTVDGRHPEGFGYGHECLPSEVADGSCPEKDTVGHGTVIASIAAGSSYGEWGLRGVAPGAELIVVKSGGPACGGSRWFFNEKGLIDGIAYAVEKARLLGRRLVVVLSLGTDVGGHDGSTPLEKTLDAWAGEGVVFIVAAGNSAADGRHVTGVLTTGRNTTLTWTIPPETSQASLSLVIGREDSARLYITTPDEKTSLLTLNKTNNVGGFLVEAFLWQHESLKEVLLEITSSRRLEGVWRLTISADSVRSGRWHAWVETDTCSNESEAFAAGLDYTISQESTVTIPGTARKVLTVGAYTTRTEWTAGDRRWNVAGDVGGLEYYSGRGPTTDGRTKPDIVAPGGVIIAAGSRDAVRKPYTPGGLTAVSRGTSMSAPHAAGVAALALQLAPNLAVEELFNVLRRNARVDEKTGPIPLTGSNLWGWGKLNADIAYVANITIQGRVVESRPTLYLNGASLTKVLQNTAVRVLLVRNTFYNIALSFPPADVDVRYRAEPSFFTIQQERADMTFRVHAEYRLVIHHPNGSLLKEWWGLENSVVRLDEILKETSLDGVVSGYSLEDGRVIMGKTLNLSTPMRITLVLSKNSSNQLIPVTGALIASVLSVALVVLLRNIRRRMLGRSPLL